MRFKDRKAETVQMVETLGLILSLGAIFIQIWILMSGMESFLEGEFQRLAPAVAMSGMALLCCALTAWTTTLNFFKPKNGP